MVGQRVEKVGADGVADVVVAQDADKEVGRGAEGQADGDGGCHARVPRFLHPLENGKHVGLVG